MKEQEGGSKELDSLVVMYLATNVTIESEGHLVPVTESALLSEGIVHVITAWNPGDDRPGEAANRAANTRLHQDLVDKGLSPVRALGSDPNSNHFEESWAVVGLTDHEAASLGATYGQVAIFKFTENTQIVLACDETWAASRNLDTPKTHLPKVSPKLKIEWTGN